MDIEVPLVGHFEKAFFRRMNLKDVASTKCHLCQILQLIGPKQDTVIAAKYYGTWQQHHCKHQPVDWWGGVGATLRNPNPKHLEKLPRKKVVASMLRLGQDQEE